MSIALEQWFIEKHRNTQFGLRVKEKLYGAKSKFQKIEVYDTFAFGKALIIDDCMMLTERDEFVYHEVITHVPMSLLHQAHNVLIIGAGDGGVLRELSKYPEIKKMTLCEIDADVIAVSKKYFPNIAKGFNDPRAEVFIGDGLEYVEKSRHKYDLIIVDSTDPIGPGEVLFSKEFYKNLARILTDDGLLVAQTESPWYSNELLGGIQKNIASAFKTRIPYAAPIPSYPLGYWGWTIASQRMIDIEKDINSERIKSFSDDLKFVNKQVLKAIFAIPQFYKNNIKI